MFRLNKNIISVFTIATLLLGIISLLWLVYDYFLYNQIKPVILGFGELGRLEQLAEFVWLSYLFMFMVHIIAGITLLLHLRYFRVIGLINILIVLFGITSFLAVFSDWAILGDISKEYEAGLDTSGEWPILYILLGIHTIFFLLLTGVSAAVLRRLKEKRGEEMTVQKDEMVFTAAQYVGLICGVIGLFWTVFALVVSQRLPVSYYHMLASSIMILIPYGLVVLYWFILKCNEKIGDWYDEKQSRDVYRSGFTTLVLTIPLMLALFLVIHNDALFIRGDYFWFPFLIFTSLFLFSLLTLVSYRRT
ncbi:MAG: hypothetical protein AMS26_06700 [Bacteroides sp. SM23_62]|nr:MAG: hypothetical protein AMS26_06700 [Bacteroides sp. SM23_62]